MKARLQTGQIRVLRLAMYLAGLGACAVTSDGSTQHAFGGIITIVALALYWVEQPGFFRIVMMWCAGYLLIITPEGLSNADSIRSAFNAWDYDVASQCIVASHLTVLLGHDLVFNESDVRPPRSNWRLKVNVVAPLLFVSTALSLLYLAPLALQTFRTGRVGTEIEAPSVVTAVLQGFSTSASVAVPVAAMWIARRVSGSSRRIMIAIALFSISTQFLLGVRFLLLFSAVGGGVAWIAPRKPTRRVMGAIVLFAVLLALVSTVLRKTRVYGLEKADVGGAVQTFSISDFAMQEDVVYTMSEAVEYSHRSGYTNGRSLAALAVFWVPRAVWADKPTLIGYWLPRKFAKEGAFGPSFSSAAGFAGESYLDLGVWGSAAFWFLGGLCFGLVERFAAAVTAAAEDARVILIAPLYGGCFFGVRSIETAMLVFLGILLFTLAILMIGGTIRRAPLPVTT